MRQIATGNPEARVNAVRAARIWGRVCFVGEGNTTTFDISPDIIHKQLTIHGSWTRVRSDGSRDSDDDAARRLDFLQHLARGNPEPREGLPIDLHPEHRLARDLLRADVGRWIQSLRWGAASPEAMALRQNANADPD